MSINASITTPTDCSKCLLNLFIQLDGIRSKCVVAHKFSTKTALYTDLNWSSRYKGFYIFFFFGRHLTVHCKERRYTCTKCQFSARTISHLKRHARLHTGSKPFSCPHCSYKCNTLVSFFFSKIYESSGKYYIFFICNSESINYISNWSDLTQKVSIVFQIGQI